MMKYPPLPESLLIPRYGRVDVGRGAGANATKPNAVRGAYCGAQFTAGVRDPCEGSTLVERDFEQEVCFIGGLGHGAAAQIARCGWSLRIVGFLDGRRAACASGRVPKHV